MTDPLRDVTTGKAASRQSSNWLKGRSDRKEYWVYSLAVMGLFAVLSLLGVNISGGAATGALFIIQIRRFHDFGRSGWWAGALLVAQTAVTIPLVFMGDVGIGIAVVLGLAVVAVLGAIPGDPIENRYGPPRGKRSLAAVFS